MPGLIDAITTTLLHSQNQFASGGLLLMVIGGIAAYLKGIPAAIYDYIHDQVTIQLTITDEQEAFHWFKWWFQNQEYASRFRNIDAYTPYTMGGWQVMLAPAPGRHWFFRKGRPLFIAFERSEDKKGAENAWRAARRTEKYYIWTFGRDQTFMHDLLSEIRQIHDERFCDKPILKLWRGDGWMTAPSYTPRTLDSVIIPQDQKDVLLHDINEFKKSAEWYRMMGIPFHRGYLLFGSPGTGKTSLVTGLSSHFSCYVYVVKLSELTDSSLVAAISDVHDDSMVVLEDVDCAVNKRQIANEEPAEPSPDGKPDGKGEKGGILGVTLSGLLNALDGLQTPAGVMFFMTTNHIEKLDHALLRPGRTDVKMFFGPATERQKLDLYKRFFPQDDEITQAQLVQQFPSAITMAEWQETLMKERNRRSSIKSIEPQVKAEGAGE